MKAFHLFLVLAAATFVSCERHDFEETKKLSEHHGAHPEHAEGATGEHAPKGEH